MCVTHLYGFVITEGDSALPKRSIQDCWLVDNHRPPPIRLHLILQDPLAKWLISFSGKIYCVEIIFVEILLK